jgi:DNA polymerase III alpha subunit
MQSAMAHAVHEIRRTTGRHLDLDDPDHVPFDDPATFEMIRRSDTLGCLQIDSVSSSAGSSEDPRAFRPGRNHFSK